MLVQAIVAVGFGIVATGYLILRLLSEIPIWRALLDIRRFTSFSNDSQCSFPSSDRLMPWSLILPCGDILVSAEVALIGWRGAAVSPFEIKHNWHKRIYRSKVVRF